MVVFLINLLFIFLSALSSFAISCHETLLNAAADTLAESGYLSMALNIHVLSETLIKQCSGVTVFAPSDPAFSKLGLPPLPLLQYHISPLGYTIQDLKTYGMAPNFRTLLFNQSLTITAAASDGQLSINTVKVYELAVFEDGSAIVCGIGEFFDPSFQISQELAPEPCPRSLAGCDGPTWQWKPSGFDQVSDLLRSRGYYKMAPFLDMQLAETTNQTKLTVFAPIDGAIEESLKNFSDFSVLFRKHVVPSWLTWMNLANDGTVLETYVDGFTINVASSPLIS